MRRLSTLFALIATTALTTTLPAGAITNGELDGDLHPNVGVIGCRTSEGVDIASGNVELVSPTVALTAAHVIELAGALQDYPFVTVGYGAYLDCSAFPSCTEVFDDTRRFATVSYNGHSSGFITLQMNATATGQGGFCTGDSGGANFLGGPDSNLMVGVTSFASRCEAVGWAQRLDTPSVRSFLAAFVTLP